MPTMACCCKTFLVLGLPVSFGTEAEHHSVRYAACTQGVLLASTFRPGFTVQVISMETTCLLLLPLLCSLINLLLNKCAANLRASTCELGVLWMKKSAASVLTFCCRQLDKIGSKELFCTAPLYRTPFVAENGEGDGKGGVVRDEAAQRDLNAAVMATASAQLQERSMQVTQYLCIVGMITNESLAEGGDYDGVSLRGWTRAPLYTRMGALALPELLG